MTQEDKKILQRINDYANEVMPDIDPQKTQVSVQLEKLKPIMETIAAEQGISLEDMFIKYMDLASEMAVTREQELKNAMEMYDNNNRF
ncbi:MAG: hypothetical protein IKJ15_03000 [Lachnospiraceae bacterium]|nr:hypothetical protein [Lachnospiraceae bacterium]